MCTLNACCTLINKRLEKNVAFIWQNTIQVRRPRVFEAFRQVNMV